MPSTSPPEIVQVDEQGGEVTLKTVHATHSSHPGKAMGGPVELSRVWAFQADDHSLSRVVGKGCTAVIRVTGEENEEIFDDDV